MRRRYVHFVASGQATCIRICTEGEGRWELGQIDGSIAITNGRVGQPTGDAENIVRAGVKQSFGNDEVQGAPYCQVDEANGVVTTND